MAEIQQASSQDDHLQKLQNLIVSWKVQHFPIYQKKPCQLDWQKLVLFEKIGSVLEKLSSLLKTLIIAGWPNTKDVLHADLKAYWSYRDELAVIDGVILKGRHIIIPTNLRCQILEQLHRNHMGIKKKKNYLLMNLYIGPALMLILITSQKIVPHVFTFSRCS